MLPLLEFKLHMVTVNLYQMFFEKYAQIRAHKAVLTLRSFAKNNRLSVIS